MTEKRFRKGKSILTDFHTCAIIDEKTGERYYDGIKPSYISSREVVEILNKLNDENEQLKKGMIGVVDRYIKNVECNPPSSARTYMKIKKALINIREDLRDLIGDLE